MIRLGVVADVHADHAALNVMARQDRQVALPQVDGRLLRHIFISASISDSDELTSSESSPSTDECLAAT